jgi:hypothetical protein
MPRIRNLHHGLLRLGQMPYASHDSKTNRRFLRIAGLSEPVPQLRHRFHQCSHRPQQRPEQRNRVNLARRARLTPERFSRLLKQVIRTATRIKFLLGALDVMACVLSTVK